YPVGYTTVNAADLSGVRGLPPANQNSAQRQTAPRQCRVNATSAAREPGRSAAARADQDRPPGIAPTLGGQARAGHRGWRVYWVRAVPANRALQAGAPGAL